MQPSSMESSLMRFPFFLLVVVTLTGCATAKAIVPSLDGKPRVPINKQVPPQVVNPAVTNATRGE
jgi:hypothetical protein